MSMSVAELPVLYYKYNTELVYFSDNYIIITNIMFIYRLK